MTLTVRLTPSLEEALDAHCARTGETKSHVVQECLAEYLLRQATPHVGEPVSENFAAFRRAGLVGSVEGSGRSATKEAVRAHVRARQDRKR